MVAQQPAGTIRPLHFRRRAIETGVSGGWPRAASYSDQPFHAADPAERNQHSDGSNLVGAGESVRLDRPAPPPGAGSAVAGSSPDRYRASEPQSLRPSGSSHFATADRSW